MKSWTHFLIFVWYWSFIHGVINVTAPHGKENEASRHQRGYDETIDFTDFIDFSLPSPLLNGNTNKNDQVHRTAPSLSGATTMKSSKKLIWNKTVKVNKKNVAWVRLIFDKEGTFLRKGKKPKKATNHSSTTGGWGPDLPGDVIRLTSMKDKYVQYLNHDALQEWSYTSAFFNGQEVRIDLFEDTKLSKKDPRQPYLQLRPPMHNLNKDLPIPDALPQALCETYDRREKYEDTKSARLFPSGCTAWIINDAEGCMLSAGHCFDADSEYPPPVLQLHVPLSQVSPFANPFHPYQSVPQHPPPHLQFVVDIQSLQAINQGDEDMAYFGTFPNPNTGKTYKDVAHATFVLPPVSATPKRLHEKYKPGTQIRVSGYGTVHKEVARPLSLTLQTHVDTIAGYDEANHLVYHRADTEGGNSGSAVVIANTNIAIAIHLHGTCEVGRRTSGNQAVLVTHPSLQRFLKSPKGICKTKMKKKIDKNKKINDKKMKQK